MAPKRDIAQIAEQVTDLLDEPLKQFKQGIRFVEPSKGFESKNGKVFLISKKTPDVLGNVLQVRFKGVGLTQLPKAKGLPEDDLPQRGVGYFKYTVRDEEITTPKMKIALGPEHREQLTDVLEQTVQEFLANKKYDPNTSRIYQDWFDLEDGTKVSEATYNLRNGLDDFVSVNIEDSFEQPAALSCYLDGSSDVLYQDIAVSSNCRFRCIDEKGRELNDVEEDGETVYYKKKKGSKEDGIRAGDMAKYIKFCDSDMMRRGSWKADVTLRLTSMRLQKGFDTNGKAVIFPVFRFRNNSTTVLQQYSFGSSKLKEESNLIEAAIDHAMMSEHKPKKAKRAKLSVPKTPVKSARKKLDLTSDDEEEDEDDDAESIDGGDTADEGTP